MQIHRIEITEEQRRILSALLWSFIIECAKKGIDYAQEKQLAEGIDDQCGVRTAPVPAQN